MDSTFAVVRDMCAEVLKTPAEELDEQTKLAELDADSLDIAEINVRLEEHFQRDFGDEMLREANTLGALAVLVSDRLS